jgi:hypothetical protein
MCTICQRGNKFSSSSGPFASYIYPATPHVLRRPQSEILAKVSPNTATGCAYTLTSEETKLTTERIKTIS